MIAIIDTTDIGAPTEPAGDLAAIIASRGAAERKKKFPGL